ncbi:MAG: saccharopine dehydrogenase C-terminal domain-containing protein [Thermodesulfobacteriota bacterium]
MKIVVLGGLGLQGKATLVDLARQTDVTEVICTDVGPDRLGGLAGLPGMDKVRIVELDASSKNALLGLLSQGATVAIDLLPFPLMATAFEAALEAGVPLVSTNYAATVRHLDGPAREKGVSLMPECGLDPGIDLVLIGNGVRRFDRIEVLRSYCGGIPEPKACTNPLKYKISWNWEMVLTSQMRPSVFIRDGRRLEVPAEAQHETDLVHSLSFPGLGELEAIPNGDAVFYTDLLGVTGTIRHTGRYSLRWPGWVSFWRPLKRLGFLDDRPRPGLPAGLSPKQFLVKLLEPQLRYEDHEKDLAVMVNVFEGVKDGRRRRLTNRLLIERDLTSGLYAMSLGVGYTAAIVARMIARREIVRPGILSPVTDIPYGPFMAELSTRNILVEEEEEWLD